MKKAIVIATLTAVLTLSVPSGDISNYDCLPPPQNPAVLAYNPPSAVYAAERVFQKPVFDYSNKINNKPVHLYNFDLNSIRLEILMGDEKGRPRAAGYYLEHLLSEHGDNLEFVADAGYYCMRTGISVGRIIVDGDVKARGSFDGGIYLLYRDGEIEMTPDFNLEQRADFDWVHGGFGRLVLNHRLDTHETRTKRGRNLSYWAKKPRIAFVIYDDGNAGIALYTGNLNEFAHGLKAVGARDACLLDSGNSRAYYYRNLYGEFVEYTRQNPSRKIKSVVYGVRN